MFMNQKKRCRSYNCSRANFNWFPFLIRFLIHKKLLADLAVIAPHGILGASNHLDVFFPFV